MRVDTRQQVSILRHDNEQDVHNILSHRLDQMISERDHEFGDLKSVHPEKFID